MKTKCSPAAAGFLLALLVHTCKPQQHSSDALWENVGEIHAQLYCSMRGLLPRGVRITAAGVGSFITLHKAEALALSIQAPLETAALMGGPASTTPPAQHVSTTHCSAHLFHATDKRAIGK